MGAKARPSRLRWPEIGSPALLPYDLADLSVARSRGVFVLLLETGHVWRRIKNLRQVLLRGRCILRQVWASNAGVYNA